MADKTGRLWAIGQVTARNIRSIPEMARGMKVAELFGCNTFDLATMRQKLPKASAQSLHETIRRGTRLDPSIQRGPHGSRSGPGEGGHDSPLVTADGAHRGEARAFLTGDDEGMPMGGSAAPRSSRADRRLRFPSAECAPPRGRATGGDQSSPIS